MLKIPIFLLFLSNFHQIIAENTDLSQIEKEWNETLNTLDAYKLLLDNVELVLVFKEFGPIAVEEIEKLSIIDQHFVRHGFRNHYYISVCLAGLAYELKAFFDSQEPYNRTEIEASLWIPSKLEKYEQFFAAFHKITPLTVNMRKMKKSLTYLAKRSDRLEVELILEVVVGLEGIDKPEILRDNSLIQRTKNMLKTYDFLDSDKALKKNNEECPLAMQKEQSCDLSLVRISLVTFFMSLATTLISIWRMRTLYKWRNNLEEVGFIVCS